GDPAQVILGDRGTPEQLQSLRHYLGLDAPIPVQYARWLGRVASGDLGYSMLNGIPVRDTLARTLAVDISVGAGGAGGVAPRCASHGHLRWHSPALMARAAPRLVSRARPRGARLLARNRAGVVLRRSGPLGAPVGLRALRGESGGLGAEPGPAGRHPRRGRGLH